MIVVLWVCALALQGNSASGDESRRYVLAIDKSGSVKNFFPLLKGAAVATAAGLPDGSRLSVFFFDTESSEPISVDALNQRSRKALVRSLESEKGGDRGTDLYRAVETAMRELGEESGDIVIFSDGMDRAERASSPLPEIQVTAVNQDVRIHCISLSAIRPENDEFQRLADGTRGRYTRIAGPNDLIQAFLRTMGELGHFWQLRGTEFELKEAAVVVVVEGGVVRDGSLFWKSAQSQSVLVKPDEAPISDEQHVTCNRYFLKPGKYEFKTSASIVRIIRPTQLAADLETVYRLPAARVTKLEVPVENVPRAASFLARWQFDGETEFEKRPGILRDGKVEFDITCPSDIERKGTFALASIDDRWELLLGRSSILTERPKPILLKVPDDALLFSTIGEEVTATQHLLIGQSTIGPAWTIEVGATNARVLGGPVAHNDANLKIELQRSAESEPEPGQITLVPTTKDPGGIKINDADQIKIPFQWEHLYPVIHASLDSTLVSVERGQSADVPLRIRASDIGPSLNATISLVPDALPMGIRIGWKSGNSILNRRPASDAGLPFIIEVSDDCGLGQSEIKFALNSSDNRIKFDGEHEFSFQLEVQKPSSTITKSTDEPWIVRRPVETQTRDIWIDVVTSNVSDDLRCEAISPEWMTVASKPAVSLNDKTRFPFTLAVEEQTPETGREYATFRITDGEIVLGTTSLEIQVTSDPVHIHSAKIIDGKYPLWIRWLLPSESELLIDFDASEQQLDGAKAVLVARDSSHTPVRILDRQKIKTSKQFEAFRLVTGYRPLDDATETPLAFETVDKPVPVWALIFISTLGIGIAFTIYVISRRYFAPMLKPVLLEIDGNGRRIRFLTKSVDRILSVKGTGAKFVWMGNQLRLVQTEEGSKRFLIQRAGSASNTSQTEFLVWFNDTIEVLNPDGDLDDPARTITIFEGPSEFDTFEETAEPASQIDLPHHTVIGEINE
ncbi:MAG: vWA domain-containing protein [Planctomycetota bacterium]